MFIIKTIIVFSILTFSVFLLYLVGKTLLTGPAIPDGAYDLRFWIVTYMALVIAGWPIWKFVKALMKD